VSERGYKPNVKRILVALDTSPHSLAALEAAVDLANRFRAELLGLFVEDANLLRLARLPFAWEVSLFSARRRQLDTQEIELQLQAQATRIRRVVAGVAERTQVSWSFHVRRGGITSEVLTAASEVDILVLGKLGCSPIAPRGLGSTARAVLAGAPCLALLVQQGTHLGPPVVVVYDGSPLAEKALEAAAALVKEGESLTVLILADGSESARELRAQVDEKLRDRKLRVHYRSLTRSNVAKLAYLVQMERTGTLVLPVQSSLLRDEALLRLLAEIEVPVLLVR
jgi:nucleotide-binding universal stress UspA family protein